MQASAPRTARKSADTSTAAVPAFLATSMLPDVVDGSPSKSTHLQRRVLAVVGLLTGNAATVTFERLVAQWPAWVPMPHEKVLRLTLRRLVEREVVELAAGRGYRVNRELAGAAAARGARFRFLASDFNGSLTPLEADVLALMRGMRSARGHSAGHLAKLLGRDERSIRGAIVGRGAQDEGGKATAGLIANGRLHVAGETRLRRGNRVPVLVVVEQAQPADPLGGTQHRSPETGNRSPGRGNRSPDTLDSARLDPAGLDHPAPSIEPAPVEPIQSGAADGADDPIRPQLVEPQNPSTASVVAMPAVAEVAADEAAGRAALSSWPALWRSMRRAVEVVQVPTSGDLPGYAAAWFAVLSLAGVLVPARPWKGRGPTTLRQRRRDLAERLAREQGHPDVGATWLYTMGRQLEFAGKAPSKLAAALLASVTPKDRAKLAGTTNPAGVELSQLVKPQGGDDAKRLPPRWLDAARSQADADKVTAMAEVIAGITAAGEVREVGGDVATRMLRARTLANADRAQRERDERAREHQRRGDQLAAIAGRTA